MRSVLLRLEGPMQSWGTTSRFEIRETEREPSKSGVIGLVGAAMGVARDDRESLVRLASLRMAVRIDRPGVVRTDYQTAGGGTWPGRRRYFVAKANEATPPPAKTTTISTRHYLADASFLVALGGEDGSFIEAIHTAIRAPRFAIWLGRKGYLPSTQVAVGVVAASPVDALKASPPNRRREHAESANGLEIVADSARQDGEMRRDVPIDFTPDQRVFGVRYIERHWVPLDNLEDQ